MIFAAIDIKDGDDDDDDVDDDDDFNEEVKDATAVIGVVIEKKQVKDWEIVDAQVQVS